MVGLRERTASSMQPALHTKTASTRASSPARAKSFCCSPSLFKSLLVSWFFLLGFMLFLSGQWTLLSVQTAHHLLLEKQQQQQQQQQRRHFSQDHFQLQMQPTSRLATHQQELSTTTTTNSHRLRQQYPLPQKQQQQQRLERNSDKVNVSSAPSTTRQLLESRDSSTRTPLAWKIVSSAFQETYVHLKQCCDDKRAAIQRDYSSSSSSSSSSTTTQQEQEQEQQYKEEQVFVECLAETRTTSGSTWPWWFQTLLRDASPYSTLHSEFHDFWMRLPPEPQTNNNVNGNQVNQHDSNAFLPPPLSPTTPTSSLLQFCAIEKISSTTWGTLQCKLNYDVKSNKLSKAGAAAAAANASTVGGSDGGGRERFFFNRTKEDRVTIGGGQACTLQLTAEEADYYLGAASSSNNKDNDKDTTNHAHDNQDNEHYKHNHKRIQRAVFLRDPLERFLSGFLDKCVRKVDEMHCEPNQLFSVSDATIRQAEHAASGRQSIARRYDITHENRTLTTDLIPPVDKGRRDRGQSSNASHIHFLLDAYVEIFPLSWNVHFYPQSLYCNGLFLDQLKDYDFVGTFFRDAAIRPAGVEGGRHMDGWSCPSFHSTFV